MTNQPDQTDKELDEILRKAIDGNQYYDGDTSYMPITALNEAKAALLALQARQVRAVLEKLKDGANTYQNNDFDLDAPSLIDAVPVSAIDAELARLGGEDV